MRMQKAIAVVLILFATISLLAHIVLPHCHHNDSFCFSLEELLHHHSCSNSCSDCFDRQHEKSHHHHETSENCDLKEFILRKDSRVDVENIIQSATFLSQLSIIYPLGEFYLDASLFGLWQQQKPYLNAYTQPFVGSISCLRAPPFSNI